MKANQRIKDACGFLCAKYAEQYVVLHGNLSRFTGLLIMLNVTLFFVGGAVIHEGYYYTFYESERHRTGRRQLRSATRSIVSHETVAEARVR